jgi:hypothetical protein
MKESPSNDERALRNTLRAWRVSEPLPLRFGQNVWQRIAREGTEPPLNPWSAFAAWMSQALARPALAVSYVTVLLLVGLAAGYWHAQQESAHGVEQLGARYVRMMDPYQMPGH